MKPSTGRHATALDSRHRVRAAVAVAGVGAISAVATVIGMAPVATAATTPTGPVIFTIASNSVTSNKAPLTVVGAINAKGTDIEGETADLVKLPRGTFKIGHASAPTAQHDALNPTTCVDLYSESGKFSVGHGTGVYNGVTGNGTYNVAATSHFKRVSGKCDENVTPISSYEVIVATATVK